MSLFDSDVQPSLLLLTVFIAWLLFQIIFVVTIYIGNNACLYTFWAPSESWWSNPFWFITFTVGGLAIMATFQTVKGIEVRSTYQWFTGVFSLVFLCIWAYGLNGLWDAMLYERGVLSGEDWFRNKEWVANALGFGGLNECRPAI